MKKLTAKKLKQQIGTFWAQHGNGVAVHIMDIGKIFKEAEAAYATTPTLEAIEESVKASVVKYRTN